MKFSVGVEYAIHSLLYLVDLEAGKSVGIRDLATFQNISESYLAKTLTKLSKAHLITATSGMKGGYRLAKAPQDISFWDIIAAVEGNQPMFQCNQILDDFLVQPEQGPEIYRKSPCVINDVMFAAENEMRKYLANVTLTWLHDTVYNHKFTEQQREETISWFQNHSW